LGNFQNLKKLIPIEVAWFMVPDRQETYAADAWRTCTPALENAHAAADLEEEAMIRDAAAHPDGRFVARIRSSGTTAENNPQRHQQQRQFTQAKGRECGLEVNNSRLTGVTAPEHLSQDFGRTTICFRVHLDGGAVVASPMVLCQRRKVSDPKVSLLGNGCSHNDTPRKMGC
jgi:hypothetical protein